MLLETFTDLPAAAELPERWLIIYHGNCPDGFGAAYLTHRRLRAAGVPEHRIASHAASYEETPPYDEVDLNTNVILVDFCYPAAALIGLAAMTRNLQVFDHHHTAAAWAREAATTLKAKFVTDISELTPEDLGQRLFCLDQNLSGIGQAAFLCYDGDENAVPRWVWNLQDRDLWKFELDDTHEVFAYVTSFPYDKAAWDYFAGLNHAVLVEGGRAITRYRNEIIKATVETAHPIQVGEFVVESVACPYAIGSDTAHILAMRHPELFAAYYVPKGDTVRFGLRGTKQGINVAEVAEGYGGGGHKQAAGFEVPFDVFVKMMNFPAMAEVWPSH